VLTEDSTIKDLDGTFQDADIYYQVRLWFTHNYSSSPLCGVCISLRFIFAKIMFIFFYWLLFSIRFLLFFMLLISYILGAPL
jgi:hypothetical protein